LVPASLPAHARLLHPVRANRSTRWAELAERRGLSIGPSTSFADASGLVPESPAWDDAVASDGSLPPAQLDALRDLLRHFTASPKRCRFMFWDGWGIYGGDVAYSVSPGLTTDEVDALEAVRVTPEDPVAGG
jgi:hypothetical protein